MDTLEIFLTQFVLSVIVFALIARWYIAPWLAQKPRDSALAILILPHTLRHLGLAFLVPGQVTEAMPADFAAAAGYGDLATGLLALLAVIALRYRWAIAIALVWLFNVVGTFDLLNALRQAEAVPHFVATWYIPTFVVPILLVSHVMVFVRLLDRNSVAKPATKRIGVAVR